MRSPQAVAAFADRAFRHERDCGALARQTSTYAREIFLKRIINNTALTVSPAIRPTHT